MSRRERALRSLGNNPKEGVRGGTMGSPTIRRGNYMAVRLRLTRVGSKKNPIYRVVAADSHSPRDGKFIEIVGRYNPQHEPSLIEFDEEKVRGWLQKGALPTEPVARLLKAKGIK